MLFMDALKRLWFCCHFMVQAIGMALGSVSCALWDRFNCIDVSGVSLELSWAMDH